MKRNFWANWAFLIIGLLVIVTGLVLQVHYHLMKSPADATFWGLTSNSWNGLHVWSSIVFLVVAVWHVWAHRKWYKAVLSKRLFSKNRTTLLLSLTAILAVVTGLAPWIASFFSSNTEAQSAMVEIHDKVALLLLVFVVLHLAKRLKWYRTAKRA